jgi:hypothetical protein
LRQWQLFVPGFGSFLWWALWMETMNGEEATQYILPVQLLLLTSVFRCLYETAFWSMLCMCQGLQRCLWKIHNMASRLWYGHYELPHKLPSSVGAMLWRQQWRDRWRKQSHTWLDYKNHVYN